MELKKPAKKPNILIVDDMEDNLIALECLLESLDCNIIKAMSGEEALKKLLEQKMALILLDVQMPVMNGFETAELIRNNEATKYIPIIFITAISMEQQYIFKGYEAGAVDYICKPYPPKILKNKVKIFIKIKAEVFFKLTVEAQ